MRLIDADSLIEDLELLAKHEENFRQSVILGVVHTIKARSTIDAMYRKICEAEIAIGKTQTADVAPVRHGRWIEQEKYTFGTMYDCSICDNRILDNGHSWNYCPNCGAKMDEVSE